MSYNVWDSTLTISRKNNNFQNRTYLASIWVKNNLASIVISVKILGLKFRPYIAVIKKVDNAKNGVVCRPAGYIC
jgi:hypothetical protein